MDEKCNVVKNAIKESRCDICCLQETKWSESNPSNHARVLPSFFVREGASLQATGTSGGVLISWKRSFTPVNSWVTKHTV